MDATTIVSAGNPDGVHFAVVGSFALAQNAVAAPALDVATVDLLGKFNPPATDPLKKRPGGRTAR